MNIGLYFAVAVICAGVGFAFGVEACAKADTVGPGDPGTAPCILSIDWTTQRQAPAVYPAKAAEELLTPPVVPDSPAITTNLLPPIKGGGGSWLPPAPVPLPAAGLLLAAAVFGLVALARRRRG
ncbi:hypothetical protein QCN27_03760 [Cereibacter sp. SYSU M97828]|nr:hypothetical protein [Cereibacter flavus]